jgi:hypothetical protein
MNVLDLNLAKVSAHDAANSDQTFARDFAARQARVSSYFPPFFLMDNSYRKGIR